MSLVQNKRQLDITIISYLNERTGECELITEEQFEILRLYYIDHVSQKEICAKRGMSTERVRHQLYKGLYLLRKHFTPGDFDKTREILYGKPG